MPLLVPRFELAAILTGDRSIVSCMGLNNGIEPIMDHNGYNSRGKAKRLGHIGADDAACCASPIGQLRRVGVARAATGCGPLCAARVGEPRHGTKAKISAQTQEIMRRSLDEVIATLPKQKKER